MSKINEFGLREGRKEEYPYLNTKYDIIDAINEYSSCETLGFYLSIKRYINRKKFKKQNEVNYEQKWLVKKLNLTNYKFYKHLHTLFNAGLIDIEKYAIVEFFINYNIEGKKNHLVEKNILYFSTLENINIWFKGNVEKLIAEQNPEIPVELINVVSIRHKTNYIIHDYPPINIFQENNYKLVAYRDWDEEMNKFQRGENKTKNENRPSSNNQKNPPSNNQKNPPSNNQKEKNNIIEVNNTIIESPNNIINQSTDNENENIKDNSNKNKIDRLIDIDNKFKNIGYKTYKELLAELQLETTLVELPYKSWLNTVKRALWEMYYYDETKIKNRMVDQYQVVTKLQELNWNMVISAIDKINEVSQHENIKYPVAFMKTILFNEIDEFTGTIQAQLNYDLNGKKEDKYSQNEYKNRFHNFESRVKNYSDDYVEDIANNKRMEYYKKLEDENIMKTDNDMLINPIDSTSLIEKYKGTEFEPMLINIKSEITPISYETYFDSNITELKKIKDKLIIKIKGGNLLKKILENRYLSLIEKHFNSIGIKSIEIVC